MVYSTLAGDQYDKVDVPRDEGATTKTSLTGEQKWCVLLFIIMPPVFSQCIRRVRKKLVNVLVFYMAGLSPELIFVRVIVSTDVLVALRPYWKAVSKEGSAEMFFFLRKATALKRARAGTRIEAKGPGVIVSGHCNRCCRHPHSLSVTLTFSLLIISVTLSLISVPRYLISVASQSLGMCWNDLKLINYALGKKRRRQKVVFFQIYSCTC